MFEDLSPEDAVAQFNSLYPVGSRLWFGGVERITWAPARVAREVAFQGLPVVDIEHDSRPVPLRFIATIRPPAPTLAARGLTLEHGAVRCQRCGAVTGDLEHDKVCRGPALPPDLGGPFIDACRGIARWAVSTGASVAEALVNETFKRIAQLDTDRERAEVRAGKLRALLDAARIGHMEATRSLEAAARWDYTGDGDQHSLRAYLTNRAAVARQALSDTADPATTTATAPPMPTTDTRAADAGRDASATTDDPDHASYRRGDVCTECGAIRGHEPDCSVLKATP